MMRPKNPASDPLFGDQHLSARSGDPRGDGHTCTTDPQQPCGSCITEYEQTKAALTDPPTGRLRRSGHVRVPAWWFAGQGWDGRQQRARRRRVGRRLTEIRNRHGY